MRRSSKPRPMRAAAVEVHLAPGHMLALGTVATGKTVYGLLRLTSDELRLMRPKRADGRGSEGDDAWA
ncbi:MAG: hypothetical protein EPN70_22635 [Paraburkholderia sp.]|uniref:hypothetical protein n=1 Tax=Paraburkholderia sp. TaxID=1926495 RepID=UPI0012059BAF|nr:hypothetical protein [Paraburkholderia sp.]TAM00359.1 MAG: hypothetical protein EPN70_22635 [Paraburkholderia sp.]